MRYRLDPSTRLVDDGTIVVGGSPLRLFRLSAAGAAVVAAIAEGTALPTKYASLTGRLTDAGAIHPDPEPGSGPSAAEVTAIVPAKEPELAAIVALVTGLRSEGVGRVLVVDDASTSPIPPIDGAEVIRLAMNLGPGGARNHGAALADSPILVFVDADASPRAGWLQPLLDHFADDRVALVAPRITAGDGTSVLERFEHWRSPLDLGPLPARVRAGSRVSYVPAAAIVVRADAFGELGGFDESLRFGEDVDLVWRLDGSGRTVRYEPASTVAHATRPTLRRWVRQRFEYGTSAAPLAERHSGALAPVRVSGWSALAWGVGAAVSAPAGAVIAAATTAALAPKLKPMRRPFREALRLGGLGNLYAGRILASGLTRAWWPLSVLAALLSKRARRVLLLAALMPPLTDWWKDRPSVDPLRAIALRALDDVAYGAGVWAGATRHRTADPLRPDLSNWPGKRAGEQTNS